MPQPELKLTLGITDSTGSPFYAGEQFVEQVAEYDSRYGSHTITMRISDEVVGRVQLQLNDDSPLQQVELPTYQMTLTDDKTNETEMYQVTRDTPLLDQLQAKNTSIFSLFGLNPFVKKHFSFPTMAFEPLRATLETYEVSRYRTMGEDYMTYALRRDESSAFLYAGAVPEQRMQQENAAHFFYVFDGNDGKRFIGDIRYREKRIKTIPRVQIHLVKRKDVTGEIQVDKKGSINRIIYL